MIEFTEAEIISSIMKLVVQDESGCWIWTGSLSRGTQPTYCGTRNNQGNKKTIRKSVRKVLYYKFQEGRSPNLPKGGMGFRSTCGNIRCVRPAHCEPAGKKFSLTEIKKIRRDISQGTSMTVLARKYDCSIQNISQIAHRNTFYYS